MLLARTLPAALILQSATSSFIRSRSAAVTISALQLGGRSSTSTHNNSPLALGNLPAPPLGIYSSSFLSFQSVRSMGSDASKASTAPSSAPKGKSEQEWRTVLSPAQFKVLRQNGTERGFSSDLNNHSKEGVYNCAACDTPLYTSGTKFKSGCGWPAFFDAIPGAVSRKTDYSMGMKRVEVRCTACDSHLGHVFEGEGFNNPTDERHCINGICLRFDDSDNAQQAGKM